MVSILGIMVSAFILIIHTFFILSGKGRGQLCCYANDDNLLILQDVPDGGFVQRNHHGGFTPVASPGTVPFLSNYHNDRVPWEQCCPRSSSMKSCDLFRQKRPSNDCQEYQSPKAGMY